MGDTTEARALLEAATPGPWAVDESWDWHPWVRTADGEVPICQFVDFEPDEPEAHNAALIAASPRLLAALLARIEELETGIERHREDFRKSHVTGSTSWDCDEELWRLLVVRDGMNTEQEQP